MDLSRLELRDARVKITAPSDQMLEAISRATGREKSDLVREIVHAWYEQKWKEFLMVGRFFKTGEGVGAACEGVAAASEGVGAACEGVDSPGLPR